ncbi:MAG: GIY-YIG nuclease family protein [Salinivirgaceae bacterium]|nr:GIY-YIG nuclease family protein [Salinivirgaceae bacterium]
MKGYMYILLCNDGSYYTGSTTDLERRMQQHFSGEGANHTKKHPPVKLLYYEEFGRIDEAFYREKQVQGWSRRKKEALINGQHDKLPELSRSYTVVSTSSTTEMTSSEETVPSTGSGTETTGSGTETTSSGTIPSVVEPVETTDIITTTNS